MYKSFRPLGDLFALSRNNSARPRRRQSCDSRHQCSYCLFDRQENGKMVWHRCLKSLKTDGFFKPFSDQNTELQKLYEALNEDS